MEEWRDIKGYEGRYQVSSHGNVRSLPRKGEHCKRTEPIIMRLSDQKGGYKGVTLYENGERKRKLIHRLVAEAFLPNPECKPEVNHINGIRYDNNVANLEWVTTSENAIHSFVVLKRKTDNKKVMCVETGVTFDSTTEASKAMGIIRTSITKCCRRKRKTAGGYHWQYKEA